MQCDEASAFGGANSPFPLGLRDTVVYKVSCESKRSAVGRETCGVRCVSATSTISTGSCVNIVVLWAALLQHRRLSAVLHREFYSAGQKRKGHLFTGSTKSIGFIFGSMPLIYVTHECVTHEKCTHRLSRQLSYQAFREYIRDVFQLASSAPFVLTYSDPDSGSVAIVDEAEFRHVSTFEGRNRLLVKVVNKCFPPYLRVVHGQTQHVLTLPQRMSGLCYDQFHGRVRNLFKLPDSVQFAFSYTEPDFCGPQLTVSTDEELKYALKKESRSYQQYPRLDISIIEEGNENSISYSSGQSTQKTSSDIVTVSHNGTLRTLAVSPVELESTSEQFLSRIREVFTLQSSSQLELSYTEIDKVGDNSTIPVTFSKGENLKDVLSQQGRRWFLEITTNSSVVQKTSFVVKVSHCGTVRRLTLHTDEFQFSYEKFRCRVRDLFKLPPSTSFVLTYIDEDLDYITIVEDEDLRDALLLQSLHPLKINMVIVNGDSDINLNTPIAQNQAHSDA